MLESNFSELKANYTENFILINRLQDIVRVSVRMRIVIYP